MNLHSHPETESRGRAWSLAVTLLVLVTAMAYTLWWPDLVRHNPTYWLEPGDIWGSIRAAHWIQWGSPAFIYSAKSSLVTLPGFNILLTPLVSIASHFNLSETAPGIVPGIPKPTEWLLVGPFVMACAALPIFAASALARHLGASPWRRRLLALATGVAVWPTLAMWGHGEDVLALGFALYALLSLLRGQRTAAGWLLGAALTMQLYVVVLVPLFVAVVGMRKGIALASRAAVLPGFLLVAVLVPNFKASAHALFDQPNYPTVDHATPWVLIAPHIARGTVAAGPGRLIGLLLAVLVGLLGARVRTNSLQIVWLAAITLGLRGIFESVMVPYYVMPAVVMVLVVAAPTSRIPRTAAIVAGCAALTVLTFLRSEMWVYWSETTALTLAILAFAWPTRARRNVPIEAATSIETATEGHPLPAEFEPAGAALVG